MHLGPEFSRQIAARVKAATMAVTHKPSLLEGCDRIPLNGLSYVVDQNVLDWLQTNVGVLGRDWDWVADKTSATHGIGLWIRIKDPQKAMLFVLTWL